MGRAKLFKRLRKEAGYKWISIVQRKYEPLHQGWVLRLCSRVSYRNLKKALHK